jgi:hypothetical protein
MTQKATPPWDAARVNLTSKELAAGVFAMMPDDVFAKDHVPDMISLDLGGRIVEVPAPTGFAQREDIGETPWQHVR